MATTTTSYPLGAYVGNPDGSNANAQAAFEAQYSAFVHDMGGARPQYMNAFTDFTQTPSAWGANAGWTAWSWAQTGNAYVGPGSGTIPVVGLPLASNAGGWSNADTFYQRIIAGDYDADYKAIVNGWASTGYTTVQFRLGYEFNTSLMPWSPSNSTSATANADFVAAFRHVADLIHAAGAADGITAQVVWNPADVNWSAPPTALYPGNQYVDIIGTDAYSPAYPNDLTTWSSPSTATAGPQAANQSDWAAATVDLEHFWQYSNGSQLDPTPILGATGWSLANAITLAQETGKPLAIEETGAGPADSGLGPSDNPVFPQWLAGALAQAKAAGVTIQNVNVWDADLSDGSWAFSNGEKPLEQAAWGQFFGTAATGSTVPPTIPTVALGNGPDALVLAVSQDSWGTDARFTVAIDGVQIGGAPTVATAAQHVTGGVQMFDIAGQFDAGSHTVTVAFLNGAPNGGAPIDPNLYVTGAAIDGSVALGSTLAAPASEVLRFSFTEAAVARLDFTDTAGHSFSEPAPVSGSTALYSGQTGLNNNIYQWVYNGVRYVTPSAWAYVVTARVTDNTGASYALSGFVQTDAALTGAPTAPGAAAVLTVTTAQRGTILLGSGNYDVAFTAANAWGSAATNTVTATMGSGDDSFTLTGSNGLTNAVIQAGAGNDQMRFVGLAGATVTGGSGTASVIAGTGTDQFTAGSGTLNVTAGAGTETFLFLTGGGLLTIADFNAGRDMLNVDSALLGSMQEQVQADGVMISFGTDTSHGILLRGLTSTAGIAVHPVTA